MVHLQSIQLLTATARPSILNWIVGSTMNKLVRLQVTDPSPRLRARCTLQSISIPHPYLSLSSRITLMTSLMISHLIILTGQSLKKILTHIISNPFMILLQDHNMHAWNIRIKLLQAWFHHTFLFQIQTSVFYLQVIPARQLQTNLPEVHLNFLQEIRLSVNPPIALTPGIQNTACASKINMHDFVECVHLKMHVIGSLQA